MIHGKKKVPALTYLRLKVRNGYALNLDEKKWAYGHGMLKTK